MNNHNLFHKIFFINNAFVRRNKNEMQISHGQGRILTILNRKDGISTKDLSEILNIKVTSLNETLNKLQENNYIVKKPSKKDKRILLIYLTDKGRNFKLNPPKDLDVFDCLSENEKKDFDKYLSLICEEFHRKMKNENPEKYECMINHRKEILKKHFNEDEEFFKQF